MKGMSKRALPPVGGGAPLIMASGVARPHTAATGPRQQVELKLTLTASSEAVAAGRDVVHLIAHACAEETTEESVERVATLRFLFPTIAVKVPEFYGFMNELVSAGRLDDVRRIMREPGGRGRPRRSLFLVALVDQVLVENPGWSAKQAAQHIFDYVERGDDLPYIPSAPRIQNVYAEYRRWYALWRQSLFVPPDIITAGYWREPSDDPAVPDLALTRLPNALVFHLPADEVGVVGPCTFDALHRLFAMPEGRVPLVGGGDPDFGPYTKYRTTHPDNVIDRCNEGWRSISLSEWQEALKRCGLGDGAVPRQ
jgi:hypothetical protein